MKTEYTIPKLPLPFDLETKSVLKQVALARTQLAELKGVAKTIPNELILINTLSLQEAKDSSEVENIVTTQDDLYRYELKTEKFEKTPAAKEVFKYREAIRFGFGQLRKGLPLTNNVIQGVQGVLVGNTAGFRKLPGTKLRDNVGTLVYTPPQDPAEVERHMANLESFINLHDLSDWDPLVKLAVIHHQFESIHPFYDGNGRTGRILCILFLVASGLLDLPVLYLSRFITQNKGEYYGLLQAVRDSNGVEKDWQAWVLFMLRGIEITARHTISLVNGIKTLMDSYKQTLRPAFGRVYKHELLNHLFFHPYTKIEYVGREMMVQRLAASKYLEKIVGLGLLEKVKIGRVNYYINRQLVDLLVNHLKIEG
jgi:Fic family protein